MQSDRIQWYPGHMAKARRMLEEALRQVDAVCEILDARIPASSRNPDLDQLAKGLPRLVILNRRDQADPGKTALWSAYFRGLGCQVLETDGKTGAGTHGFEDAVRALLADKLAHWAARGQVGRTPRVMIAGVPNVGKSTLINRLAGRRAAKAEDRPGVTRGKQWVSAGGVELLDTPGMLWPRIDDPQTGRRLAYTGAVRDEILDTEELAAGLAKSLADCAPGALGARYGIGETGAGHELLERAARKRGFLVAGGAADTERMSKTLLDEFRGGKLGRITLELPPAGRKAAPEEGKGAPDGPGDDVEL